MFVKLTENCVVDTDKVASISIQNMEVVVFLTGCSPLRVVDSDKDLYELFDEVVQKVASGGLTQPGEKTPPACTDCVYCSMCFPTDICTHIHSTGDTCEYCRKNPDLCGEAGKWFRRGGVMPM